MRLIYVCIATLFLVASLIAFAEKVEVTKIEDNKNGAYQATELEEKGKFFHDRDYTITNIPKEFLGLTQVSTSADCPGGQDYRLTFEIDRPAYVYQAWDSRHKRPEDRGQEPKGWFTKGYTDTEKTLVLDAPHPPVEYFIYKSNEPFPEGKVELLGIDEVIGDPVIMWTIFLEEGQLPVSPVGNLTTTWGDIKTD
ncbi:hypothetical protein C6499_13975 [Candidatus Poribacteria bacterium]|nr:MAG: hypothetical protein C6499_13975 [Candidatus Poribacteria bacterium]